MTVCLYHGGCIDGFTAAWIVARTFGAADDPVKLIPMNHGGGVLAAEVAGEVVYSVDFAFPMVASGLALGDRIDSLAELCAHAEWVYVWDHHKTVMDDFAAHSAADKAWPTNLTSHLTEKMSGAEIAWFNCRHDRIWNGQIRPNVSGLVSYVGDRDLWRFAYGPTKAVFAAMTSYEQTLDVWDTFPWKLDDLVAEGRAIERYRQQQVDAHVANAFWTHIHEFDVPVVNCPYSIGSDVAGKLCELNPDAPFAAYFYETADTRHWGLRSGPDGADVAKIAERFGGGGHEHASGYRERLPRS